MSQSNLDSSNLNGSDDENGVTSPANLKGSTTIMKDCE